MNNNENDSKPEQKIYDGVDIYKNVTQCRVCKTLQPRIFAGHFADKNHTKRYIGVDGTQWMGRICPTCNRVRMAEYMQRLRNKRKGKKKEE